MKKKILVLGLISLFLIVLTILCSPGENGEPPPEEATYQICSWNLEHFSSTAKRGFPEVSPRIDPRTEEQLNALATKLTDDIPAEIERERTKTIQRRTKLTRLGFIIFLVATLAAITSIVINL